MSYNYKKRTSYYATNSEAACGADCGCHYYGEPRSVTEDIIVQSNGNVSVDAEVNTRHFHEHVHVHYGAAPFPVKSSCAPKLCKCEETPCYQGQRRIGGHREVLVTNNAVVSVPAPRPALQSRPCSSNGCKCSGGSSGRRCGGC